MMQFALVVLMATDVNYAPFAPAAKAPDAKAPEKTRVEVADTDHDVTRLRPGVGYFGRLGAPLARELDAIPVHLVGVRVWFRRSVALDLSIGGNLEGARTRAIGARAALPIALLVERHVTLYLAPTLAYAYGSETIAGSRAPNPVTGLPYTAPDAKRSGMLFSGGLRLGGELQLGSIGIARVALFGAIGLDVDYVRGLTRAAPPPSTRDPEPRVAETSDNRFALRTSFLANLGALFYF